MLEQTLSFLGGGRITNALCAGLRLAKFRGEIVVYDHNPARLRALKREWRVKTARDLKSAMECAGTLIVAVRPASFAGLLDEIIATGVSPGLCVSLVAGIPLKALSGRIRSARWVRAMPSPVCRIGRGLTATCFDRAVSTAERNCVQELFGLVGQVIEVPERNFDAFTAVYSSSHGYHALAMLASAGQHAGLDRDAALTAAAHALGDGIHYWKQSRLSLEDLLQEAATPGGVAAATVAAMDKAGFAQAVQKGIRAGIAQARQNADSDKKRKASRQAS